MVKNKIIFIIPYFGKFNSYFQLFLNSAANNPQFNWQIFTDDKKDYDYPDNVKVDYMSFPEFKNYVQTKFDFEISLEYPYRIADFRPAFGYIFSEYVKEYNFWGYGDSDIILGHLSDFWTDNFLEKVDKAAMFGHLTFIRNEKMFNEAFMKSINGVSTYKKALTENINHSFDEEFNSSINNIFINEKYRTDFHEYQANTYTKSSNLFLTKYDFDKNKYSVLREKNLFIYRNGKVINIQLDDTGNLIEREFLYIHFQSRVMENNVKNFDYFKMIPNVFEDVQTSLASKEDYIREKKKHFNIHYFKLRTSNLIKKIKKRIRK